MSRILGAADYTFAPALKQVSFAAAGFDVRRLQLIEHAPSGTLLYAAASPGLGYTGVAGATVTLAYDTSGLNAADPLRIIYADDLFSTANPGHVTLDAQGAGLATAARQDAGNSALGILAAGLGTPSDADPGSDTAAGTVIALLRRGLGRWTTFLGRFPAGLGPTSAAGSIPVTLPADGQFAASVGLPADAAAANDTGAASLIALAKRSLGRWTTLLTNFGAAGDAAIQTTDGTGSLMALVRGVLIRQLVTQAGPGGSAAIASAIQGVTGGVPVPVSGSAAVGQLPVVAPVPVSGVDGSGLKRHFLLDLLGRLLIGANAPRVTASANLSAANAAATLACDGMATATLRLSGTWAGTVTFVGSLDDGATYDVPVNMIPYSGGATAAAVGSATANGVWEMACGGLTHVRAVMSAYTSGSATALLIATTALKSVRVGNPAGNPLTVQLAAGAAQIGTIGNAFALDTTAAAGNVILAAIRDRLLATLTVTLAAGTNTIGAVTQAGTWAVNATLQAGSAIIGRVGIDQTTPGTTNGVVVNSSALPTGAAQEGTDPTSPVVAQDAGGTGSRGWLAKIAGLLKLGTANSANSASVVMATDMSNLEPGGSKITAATMPAGGTGLTGWLSAAFWGIGSQSDTAATSTTATGSVIAFLKALFGAANTAAIPTTVSTTPLAANGSIQGQYNNNIGSNANPVPYSYINFGVYSDVAYTVFIERSTTGSINDYAPVNGVNGEPIAAGTSFERKVAVLSNITRIRITNVNAMSKFFLGMSPSRT